MQDFEWGILVTVTSLDDNGDDTDSRDEIRMANDEREARARYEAVRDTLGIAGRRTLTAQKALTGVKLLRRPVGDWEQVGDQAATAPVRLYAAQDWRP